MPGRADEPCVARGSVALATGLGELRDGVLVNACDALISAGGGWGTLSEVALNK
jgi:predicted Rossmann-fold nucleotide-binding protein